MRRKTQIVLVVLANTFLVAALVCSGSYVYVSHTLRQRVTTAHENATYINSQLAYIANAEVPDFTILARNPARVRLMFADYLATNFGLNKMLESVVSTWPMIYDAAIVDADGKAIIHTNPNLIGKTIPNRPNFRIVQDAEFRRQLRLVYNPPTTYEVNLPLLLDGQSFGSIRLGISTVFLKNEITPKLREAVIFSGISILLCLLLTAGLSYIALGPLGANRLPAGGQRGDDEPGPVILNIAHP
jgi:hypothetical protein